MEIKKNAKSELAEALTQADHIPFELAAPDGSSLLILPFGARVLGLFPADAANLLWLHPLLMDGQTAKKFLQSPGWRNTGGDRTWISPEREIHVSDLSDPWNSYRVTESIDPGQFTSRLIGDEVWLETSGLVTSYRRSAYCPVHIEKRVSLIENPLHQHPNRHAMFDGVSYAGFEQVVSLRYLDSTTPFPISLWDAVNLPAEGIIIIPTGREVAPTDYFEPTGPSHLHCTSRGLNFLFDGRDRHKISLRISDLICGRVGYLRPLSNDLYSLVVRNFVLEPSADYIDTPWNAPEDTGYVVQCYNDGGLNGLYGELEYHSPAIGPGTGRSEYVDRAQLWGFQGPRSKIDTIASELLGSAVVVEAFAKVRIWLNQ